MPEMGATDELVIELSRSKVLLIILGACIFIALGYWCFTRDASEMKGMPIDDPLIVHGAGIAGMVFAGLGVIIGIRKLFDKKPGLVLNSAGIIDNSSGLSAGFIPWSDITGGEIYQIRRKKMLMIKVRNPEEFIRRGNVLRQALVRMNSKMSGSPIAITSSTLKIKFPELLARFQQYHRKYGQSMKASV
jgi:hypothetical protein